MKDHTTETLGTTGAPSAYDVTPGRTVEASVAPGDALGRFTVRDPIGAGGMGEVFSAFDPELGRTVAIKIIRRALGGDSPEARARFQREAQAMARLNHPNVVTVFEVGTVGDQVFVVMELVEGPTLRVWLAERSRHWREVQAIFLQAGEGLAAAHAAGIVHRDFKPSNVIVGTRVRVADFGLARGVNDADTEPSSPETLLDQEVTRTGEAPGTPAYMAPELRAGGAATFLSDQYAFGLCLRQALVETRHPARLRAVYERATRADPAARYPSMRKLLDDLGRDPARRTVRWLAFTAVGASLLAVALTSIHPKADPCAGGEGVMASVWNDTTRQKVAAAFRATGRPYADTTFASVDRSLTDRAARWSAAHRDACEATRVRHEQSDTLFDLRMVCLGRAQTDFAALVDLFSSADAATTDRAIPAAASVGGTAECADPGRQARDPAIETELGRMTALELVGKWPDALALGEELLPRAQEQAALAEVLMRTGLMGLILRKDVDRALERLHQSERVAAAAHADLIAARAASALLFGYGNIKQHAESAAIAYQGALAAAARAGNPPEIVNRVLNDAESAQYALESYLAALGLAHVRLGLVARLSGVESYRFGLALTEFAGAATKLGFGRDVAPLYDRAFAAVEKTLGPDHPELATLLQNAGASRLLDGDLEGGTPLLERSLAIIEKALGKDTAYSAHITLSLADARFHEGKLGQAEALARKARAIYVAQLGPNNPKVIENDGFLALVLIVAGRAEEGRQIVAASLATLKKIPSAPAGFEADLLDTDARGLLALGRAAEAHALAEKALELQDPENNLSLADTLETTGDAACATGHCAEAVPLLRRSAALVEKQVGPDGATLVEPLAHLCDALLATGDIAGAKATALRAFAVRPGEWPEEHARARFCLARVQLAEGDKESAMKTARTARSELAALEYVAPLLARVDAWLARPKL